ncbi:MAG: TlpA family protein disulfide reductase [Acidimicrobiia bacterium]
MRRLPLLLCALAVLAAACASSPRRDGAPLPPTDAEAIGALLRDSDRPVVVNVWASWCIPCRSEAPLLRRASRRFGNDIRFVGVAVRDDPGSAADFVAEFSLDFEHFFDRSGAVPAALGGRGVPHTFFFRAGGDLDYLHLGVIDERTLALHIDELLRP